MSLNGTMVDASTYEAPTGYKKIISKRYVEVTDYVDNMAFVGWLPANPNPVVVILYNALVTSPLAITTVDNNEATYDITATAHATIEQLQDDVFPWAIYYPTPTTGEGE
jgi:hypothetical protein